MHTKRNRVAWGFWTNPKIRRFLWKDHEEVIRISSSLQLNVIELLLRENLRNNNICAFELKNNIRGIRALK